MRNVWQTEEFLWKSCEWKSQHKAYYILQCILTEFEDICASVFRSCEFQLNVFGPMGKMKQKGLEFSVFIDVI